MANPVLHIKDSYYFEVPKMLYAVEFHSLQDFDGAYETWVSLDDQYQEWHFDRLYDELVRIPEVSLRADMKEEARKEWHRWRHESHDNFGKPFDVYLEEFHQRLVKEYPQWSKAPKNHGIDLVDMPKYLRFESEANEMFWSFLHWRHTAGPAWNEIRREANDVEAFKEYCATNKIEWSPEKIQAYNYHLSGKVLIPQPFARLSNLYEAHPANHWYEVAISKFMIIEVVVALIMIVAFTWLSRRVASGGAPKGKLWNLLETFLVFIRDEIAEPAIGHHDAHRFLPYLWTIFFFVLGCNLMGMVPWAGSPTGTLGVTFGLAALTFAFGMVGGMGRFGFIGYWKNLVPHMDLPLVMAIVIKPMLFLIELLGLVIKHLVLAVRLLANMMAGHLVLLGVMGVAFTAEAVASFEGNTGLWSVAALISIVSCVAFSMLELFVAFLQAYVFTFLSALFIGASLHEH